MLEEVIKRANCGQGYELEDPDWDRGRDAEKSARWEGQDMSLGLSVLLSLTMLTGRALTFSCS